MSYIERLMYPYKFCKNSGKLGTPNLRHHRSSAGHTHIAQTRLFGDQTGDNSHTNLLMDRCMFNKESCRSCTRNSDYHCIP